MTRRASTALMPLADAVARLVADVTPVAEQERPARSALGCAAAQDLIIERDWPECPTALRDGWAVEAESVTGASAYSPILPTRPPVWVESGEALPEGACTVLPPEALEGRFFVADAPAGDGVRRVGEDLRAGTRLLAAGERFAARHLLTLATAGVAAVPVRVPRIALVATGRVSPLAAFLSTLIAAEGVVPAEIVAVADDPEAIATAIREARADAVFVCGGTGPGRTDYSVAALAEVGEVRAHGIAVRPGETAAIGCAGDRPVLLLPGRPEAALAVFLTLGRPLLAALMGARPRRLETGTLSRKITSTIGVSDVVFMRRDPDGLVPLGGLDLALSRLVEAEGAILVPPDSEGYPEGTTLGILSL